MPQSHPPKAVFGSTNRPGRTEALHFKRRGEEDNRRFLVGLRSSTRCSCRFNYKRFPTTAIAAAASAGGGAAAVY